MFGWSTSFKISAYPTIRTDGKSFTAPPLHADAHLAKVFSLRRGLFDDFNGYIISRFLTPPDLHFGAPAAACITHRALAVGKPAAQGLVPAHWRGTS